MAPGAFNRGWALNVAFTFAEPEVDYVAGLYNLKPVDPQLEAYQAKTWFQSLPFKFNLYP